MQVRWIISVLVATYIFTIAYDQAVANDITLLIRKYLETPRELPLKIFKGPVLGELQRRYGGCDVALMSTATMSGVRMGNLSL